LTPNNTVDPVVQHLRALAQDLPHLKDVAQLYEIILPIIRDADLHVKPASISPVQARTKMSEGLPLLHDIDLELDMQSVHDLMLSLTRAVETFGENKQSYKDGDEKQGIAAARRIRMALEANKLNAVELLPDIAAGRKSLVVSLAERLQLDADLLWILTQNALKPALYAWRRQLTSLAKGIPWHKGSCFICGATATMGELQKDTREKHLRCVQCGADWKFSRLQCMYCGNEDHPTLGFMYPENKPENKIEKMRVEVCNKCNGYLKVIASFAPTPPEMLPVEDLATLHLDYIARDRGYARVIVQQ